MNMGADATFLKIAKAWALAIFTLPIAAFSLVPGASVMAVAQELGRAPMPMTVPNRAPLSRPDMAPSSPNIALLTLNQDRMFQSSAWGQGALQRADAIASDLILENRQIEAALEAEELELTEKRPSLQPNEFAKLALEFDTKVEEFRQTQDAKSRQIARGLEAERQAFLDRAVPVLVEILQERGAVAIIGDEALILGLSSADITDEAILRMDRLYGANVSIFGGEGLIEPAPRAPFSEQAVGGDTYPLGADLNPDTDHPLASPLDADDNGDDTEAGLGAGAFAGDADRLSPPASEP